MTKRGGVPMLTPTELAERWNVTVQRLAAMRCRGIGPAYIKLGHSVRYSADVVEAYEAAASVATAGAAA